MIRVTDDTQKPNEQMTIKQGKSSIIFSVLFSLLFYLVFLWRNDSHDKTANIQAAERYNDKMQILAKRNQTYNAMIAPLLATFFASNNKEEIVTALDSAIPLLHSREEVIDSIMLLFDAMDRLVAVSTDTVDTATAKLLNVSRANYEWQSKQSYKLDTIKSLLDKYKNAVVEEPEKLNMQLARQLSEYNVIDSGLEATKNILESIVK